MTQEEKAKAYDGLIERLKDLKFACRFSPLSDTIDEIFPELVENKDERIRKWLIHYFTEVCDNVSEKEKKSILAWLEKQGNPTDNVEPKFKVGDKIIKSSKRSCPVHSSTDDTICIVAEIHDTCYILDTKEGKIQEPFNWQDYYELVVPKTDWNEEDENILATIIEEGYLKPSERQWLKSLKYRVQPQQEWSEEDERYFNIVSAVICSPSVQGIYDYHKVNQTDVSGWLKEHIKQQSQWKPSDEQMEYLAKAITTLGNEGDNKTSSILYELRTNLKKLKG